jgi:REP element-mobilizing transposase RayT
MPQSYTRIWIHTVWGTKHRLPYISNKVESMIHDFIREQFRMLGCPVRIIDGTPDHVHSLFLLSPTKSISDIIKQVKGSSSYFINENELIEEKFGWQNGYGAFSVSDSAVEAVYRYIKNQKQHHRIETYEQEFEELFTFYDLEE